MPKLAQCKEGQFKEGDAQCGAATPTVVAHIDIDGDGYAGNGLSGRLLGLAINRGIEPELGRIVVGSAQYTLANDDGRWSPRNSASIYYPNLTVWRGVTTQRQDSTSALHYQFSGFVREIALDPDPNVQSAALDCVDLVERLRRVKVSTPLYEGKRSDEIIAALLALVGYTGSTSLEVGSKTFPYASWLRTSALDAIQQVVDSEMGVFFIGADGAPVFHNRYHRLLTTTPAATLNGTMAGLNYRLTADDVYNEALVTCYPREVGTVGELWRWLEAPRLLSPGESVTLEAEYTDSNGSACEGSAVVSPVATTDYTANRLADGSGDDLTANITVSDFTAYGRHAQMTVTNTGTATVYVTLLRIRGTPITVPSPVTMRSSDAASIATYGLLTISLDQPLETSADAARDAAAYLVQTYASPPDRIALTVRPADAARTDAMAILDLNNLVSVTETDSGLAASGFFINQITVAMSSDPLTQAITYEATAAPTALSLVILDSLTQTFADLLGY